MEIKGEDFLKNVQIKQEKEELQTRLDELDNTMQPQNYAYEQEFQQTENELDDIMLGSKSTTTEQPNDNKKKYMVLGLSLVVLFLITIVIFSLFTNKASEESSFVEKKEEISQDKALSDNNIEEQYQKIINEKLQNIKDQNQKTESENKASKKALDLASIEKEEQKVTPKVNKQSQKKANELKKDIFNVSNGTTVAKPKKEAPKTQPIKPKKEIDKILLTKKEAPKKTISKPVVKKETKVQKVTQTTTTKPKGTFIQIGAFSKPINPKYLDNIKNKNLQYVLYKVVINGKLYTKVLIGPYRNRAHAKTAEDAVKKKLQINNAFVLSF